MIRVSLWIRARRIIPPMKRLAITQRAALALSMFAPVLLAGAAAVWADSQERSRAQDMLHAQAKQLIALVDAELNRSVAVLKTLGASNVLQDGDLRGFHQLAVRVVGSEPRWQNVQLLGPHGEHLVNARVPYGRALPPLNRPDLPMRAAVTGQPVISDIEMATVAQRMLTVVYVPVMREGKVVNVLAAAIEPPNWTQVLRSKLPVGVDALLLDRYRFIITSTAPTTLPASTHVSPTPNRPGELMADIHSMRSSSGQEGQARENAGCNLCEVRHTLP